MSYLFVFGKLTREALNGRIDTSPPLSSTTAHYNNTELKKKIFLDYVITQVVGDQRPYLKVSILGCPLVGLLDSGASRTLVGTSGYEILKRVGLPLRPADVKCTVANGQSCKSLGYVSTPISLMDKTRIVDILVVPELPHQLILGVDFWMSMDIVPDLRQNVWHFSSSPPLAEVGSITSESSLSSLQKETLDRLIVEKKQVMGTSIGRTHLVQHEIELVPGAKPIKQRNEWHLVVPKEKRLEVIKRFHDSPTCGHSGIYKTVARISEQHYWPKLKADVARYIRSCETCIRTKPEQRPPQGHMLSKTPSATKPWEIVSADIIGPLPRSSRGYAYILVVCDNFSKFVMLFPLRSATANSVVQAIEDHQFTAKLAPKYIGPCTVTNIVSPWTYELEDSAGKRSIWHAKDIKTHPPDIQLESDTSDC
ncbi:hypothetical protein NQ317_012687 [Molorchus minor]|uniref:RNA-directed DNA polymerase n=1 Tax=Molorchus minor TaxID=1323400 RepID=A0ABQ9IZF0_9CUCU|nr:hypothetical protein NQ317_012687 [Molorchus minor]